MSPESSSRNLCFDGKIALVTGASRGLGAGLARCLARHGADVIVTYRRAEDKAQAVAEQVRALGRQAWVFELEMGDEASIDALFERLDAETPGLDLCVLNAAATSFRPLMDAERRHLEKTYAISVFGFLRAIQLAYPRIAARGGGTIMGISGADTRGWIPTHGVLAGAKAAMESMIRYLAVENGDAGVTILGVNPGAIRTDSVDVMLGPLADPLMEKQAESHPLRRVATPDDMAESVALLLRPEARWAHGTTVELDGGGVFAMFGRFGHLCLQNAMETPPEAPAPMVQSALRKNESPND